MEMVSPMAEKVIVTKSLLDGLAAEINDAAGTDTPMTIPQMRSAVQTLTTSTAENWTFLMEDGSTVIKAVNVG